MLITEPAGWMDLWERAQSETDTESLNAILGEMNALLAQFEVSSDFDHRSSIQPTLHLEIGTLRQPVEKD